MSISSLAAESVTAIDVKVTGDTLTVALRDGRKVSVPISWYPRLAAGTTAERRRWQLIGPGIGVHWPDLDEDISVAALLCGLSSNESAASLQRWRAGRRRPANLNKRKKRAAHS